LTLVALAVRKHDGDDALPGSVPGDKVAGDFGHEGDEGER